MEGDFVKPRVVFQPKKANGFVSWTDEHQPAVTTVRFDAELDVFNINGADNCADDANCLCSLPESFSSVGIVYDDFSQQTFSEQTVLSCHASREWHDVSTNMGEKVKGGQVL